MLKVFQFITQLPRKYKINIFILQIGIIITNLTEIFSIAIISPYIGLVIDNDKIFENKYLSYCYEFFNFQNIDQFIIILGIFIFFLISFSNVFLLGITYSTKKILNSLTNFMSTNLYSYYIKLDFGEFSKLENSVSTINSKLLNEVIRFTSNSMLSFFEINKRFFSVFFMFVVLILFEPALSLLILGFILISIFFVYFLVIRKVRNQGKIITEKNKIKLSLISESLNAIREVKFLNAEDSLTREFFKNNVKINNSDTFIYLSANIPKHVLEIFSALLFLVIIVFLYFQNVDVYQMIMTLSLVGIAAFKILPALHSILFNLSIFNGSIDSYESIKKDFNIILTNFNNKKNNVNNEIIVKDDLNTNEKIISSLNFRNFSFRYFNKKINALEFTKLDLHLDRNCYVIGETGSGKSTLLDILSGISANYKGVININNSEKNLKNNFDYYKKNLAYVPQNINFFNRSLLENITLKFIYNNEVDITFVNELISILLLEDVIKQFSHGIHSNLGENLAHLSGGQRQRMSIARALYRKKPILLLDEATSALDKNTEKTIFDNIKKLDFIKCIINSTHKTDLIENNENVILLKEGKVIYSGIKGNLNGIH